MTVHGSRCDIAQNDEYTLEDDHNEYNDSVHGTDNVDGLHDIAYISLP